MRRTDIEILVPSDAAIGAGSGDGVNGALQHTGSDTSMSLNPRSLVVHIGIVNSIVVINGDRRIRTIALGFTSSSNAVDRCRQSKLRPRYSAIGTKRTPLLTATLVYWQPGSSIRRHMKMAVQATARITRRRTLSEIWIGDRATPGRPERITPIARGRADNILRAIV